MPLPDDLRSLETDLPASPRTLLDMLALLDDDDAPPGRMADVIERDMALASAVMRTVNSAMFGLLRRVETVHEAVRYLGSREVAGITFATALRAAFPSTPQMEALWNHASQAGLLMARSAPPLGLDPWRAHAAGLFARSGQAVLLVRAGPSYVDLMARHANDLPGLLAAERRTFGLHHAALGSALCAKWGLAGDVVKVVHERGEPPERWTALAEPVRDLLTLGHLVEAVLAGQPLADAAQAAALPQGPSVAALADAVRGPWEWINRTTTAVRQD